MPTNLYIAVSTPWGKAFIEVWTHRQLFEYSVIADRQNAQKFVLPCSLDSALPKESFLLLQFICQDQANDLCEGANHSNIDGSCMNVQHDLAHVACFQSHLCSLKYLCCIVLFNAYVNYSVIPLFHYSAIPYSAQYSITKNHDWLENCIMSQNKFCYLCQQLRPVVEKQNTHLRLCISTEH